MTQGPSNPNSLDADVPAPRTAPVDAAVARGALAAAGEEARDAPAAPDDEALVVRCLLWAGRTAMRDSQRGMRAPPPQPTSGTPAAGPCAGAVR